MLKKIVSKKTVEDVGEGRLRPNCLSEFIGQKNLKENLSLFIKAARQRNEQLDHCLFYGPPGLGKTTLAYLLSKEMETHMIGTSGPALEKQSDLAAILTNLKNKDIFFIDEIHRLKPQVEEILYQAMEEFNIDIVIGKGAGAKTIKLSIAPFTLVGATTRLGLLTSPLRNRFGFIHTLKFYPANDLKTIIKRSADILKIEISDDGAEEIAKRSRGTPRIANRLLKRVRDFAQVNGKTVITKNITNQSLNMQGVDDAGFDEMDKKLLLTIIDRFGGGPVGIETLAATLGEDRGTIADVFEPYLMQNNFLIRTPKGRMATEKAFLHFKKSIANKRLF